MGKEKRIGSDAKLSTQELLARVIAVYGSRYDDREPIIKDHASLRDVARECDITLLKVRKLLITADMYSTHVSREIQGLLQEGKTIQEIMGITGLSRASVHSYVPYTKVVYNLKERSVSADRMVHARARKRACKEFMDKLPFMSMEEAENALWKVLEVHEGCYFYTAKGLKFRYKVKGGEMFIDRKKDSITKATVFMALKKAMELNGDVSGPKKLGTFGASYLYPIFCRIGLIKE